MKEKIDIIYKEYDEEHYISFFERNSKNVYFEFGLFDFENEMEYWDMPTKLVEHEGKMGYLFNKSIDKLELSDEIERFIKHNDL